MPPCPVNVQCKTVLFRNRGQGHIQVLVAAPTPLPVRCSRNRIPAQERTANAAEYVASALVLPLRSLVVAVVMR
jgi:hypothetical protein